MDPSSSTLPSRATQLRHGREFTQRQRDLLIVSPGDGAPRLLHSRAYADHPLPNSLTGLSNSLGLQAAAYEAMLPALEKIQGAELAGDHLGLVLQTELLKEHAELALASGQKMKADLDVLEGFLAECGQLGVSADVGPALAELMSGISEEDRNLLYSYGLTDAEIDSAAEELDSFEFPSEISWDALLEQGHAIVDEMEPALLDLIDQADAVRAENLPYVLRVRPVATVTGPVSGAVGNAANLTATATHDDPNAALTYAWDLDGDGSFDDGTSATAAFTPSAPGLQMVTVRVSDGAAEDYARHLVDVTISNAPPVISSASPSELSPFADVGESIMFSVEASDPDGDPLTISWRVDGVHVATVPSVEFIMPDDQPHKVTAIVADDNRTPRTRPRASRSGLPSGKARRARAARAQEEAKARRVKVGPAQAPLVPRPDRRVRPPSRQRVLLDRIVDL